MANQNELQHHGIPGMKWGVRRYQNKDGSLTAAGKKKYFDQDGELTKAGHKAATKKISKAYGLKSVKTQINKDGSLTITGKKKVNTMSDDAREAKALKKKKLSELSNAELRKLNDRKNLERNYKQLNPNAIAKGAKVVAVTAAALGTIASIQKNGTKVVNMGKSVVKKFKK